MASIYEQIAAADPWAGIRQLHFGQFTQDFPAYDTGDSGQAPARTETFMGYNQDAVRAGGYNTKYATPQAEEVAPGVYRITVQQPGAHKYDTADAYYQVDPATGMGTMIDDPTLTREVSSREKWRDRFEQRIIPMTAAVLGAGAGLGAMGVGSGVPGITTAAGAGGTAGGVAGTQAGASQLGTLASGSATGVGTLPGAASMPMAAAAQASLPSVLGSSTLGATSVAAPSLATAGAASAGFDWASLLSGKGLRSGIDILSGLYGMKLSSDARKASDPFAQYRPGYGEQLAALEANPNLITQRPGWLAGTELIQRQMASRGYTGSGNEKASMQRYAGDFYNQEANRLATLAGAGQTPGAGQFAGAQLASQSLASIGYGIAPWLPNKP